MQRFALAVVCGLALFAASVSLAAGGGRAAKLHSFPTVVSRTAGAHSLGFKLTVQIRDAALQKPYTLHANGAARGSSLENLYVKIENGPTADTKLDGTFIYFRSTGTASEIGPLWVRERLATLKPKAPELALVRQVSAQAILGVLPFAVAVRSGAGGVFHAVLPYANPYVRLALAGLEGNTEFRDLRLTAWSNRDGMLHRIRITGRTADGSKTISLLLGLGAYGKPVAVTPPRERDFLDVTLVKLAA
jgi:hypothetical protein